MKKIYQKIISLSLLCAMALSGCSTAKQETTTTKP